MAEHWTRFAVGYQFKTKDYLEGHSFVNLFAETVRYLFYILHVDIVTSAKIIKFRFVIGYEVPHKNKKLLTFGLAHILSIISPLGLFYFVLLFDNIMARRENKK